MSEIKWKYLHRLKRHMHGKMGKTECRGVCVRERATERDRERSLGKKIKDLNRIWLLSPMRKHIRRDTWRPGPRERGQTEDVQCWLLLDFKEKNALNLQANRSHLPCHHPTAVFSVGAQRSWDRLGPFASALSTWTTPPPAMEMQRNYMGLK